MRARDTTEKAAAIQAVLNRALTPEQRFQQVLEVSDFAREFAKAGLRQRHPEYTEEQLMPPPQTYAWIRSRARSPE